MFFVVLGFIALILLLVLLDWLSKTTPANVMKFAGVIGSSLVILAILSFLFSGKIFAAFPMLAGAWIAFNRYRKAKFYWDMSQNWANWQKGAGAGAGGSSAHSSSNAMSRAEALYVMGLKEGANDEDIKDSYSRLMKKMHPDHGGTDYLASKLNEAKHVLLNK